MIFAGQNEIFSVPLFHILFNGNELILSPILFGSADFY